MEAIGTRWEHLVDEIKLASFRPPGLPIQLLSDPFLFTFCVLRALRGSIFYPWPSVCSAQLNPCPIIILSLCVLRGLCGEKSGLRLVPFLASASRSGLVTP